MSIDTLQKGSMKLLAWLILYLCTSAIVYRIVWPPDRLLAARLAGQHAIDVARPLPVGARVSIYAVPTVVIGGLVLLYRRGRHR